MAKRISIINFKGGVGKTALALHLATGLVRYHDKRVLLIDVDHQSSLSLVCLPGKEWQKLVDEGKTIDAIFEHFTKSNVPLPNKDIIRKNPYDKNPYQNSYERLDLVPATLKLDETEIELSSTTVGDSVQSEWNKRTLLCRWLDENMIDRDYDYIIFDCPPATKLVTQNAIAASHGYILPVIPDAVSTRGIPHLISRVFSKIDGEFSGLSQFLKSKGKPIFKSYVPSTKLIGIVISKIKHKGLASRSRYTTDHTTHLETLKKLYGKEIVEPYIHEGVGVPECLAAGYPVYDYSESQNVRSGNFIKHFKLVVENLMNRIDNCN